MHVIVHFYFTKMCVMILSMSYYNAYFKKILQITFLGYFALFYKTGDKTKVCFRFPSHGKKGHSNMKKKLKTAGDFATFDLCKHTQTQCNKFNKKNQDDHFR